MARNNVYSTKADLLKAVKTDSDCESKFLIDYLVKGRFHQFTFDVKSEVLFETTKKLSWGGHYYFNEMVVSGVRRKPYLDVETVYESKAIFDQNYRSVVNGLVIDIMTIFRKKYGQMIKGCDIKLLDSSGPAKGGWKISLHVIIAPVDRTLYYTESRASTSSSYDFYESLLPLNPIYNDLLDDQVYGTDLNLRIIGSAKEHNDLRTLTPIDPISLKPIILTDKQKLDYMLTHINPDRPTIELKTPIYKKPKRFPQLGLRAQLNKPLTTKCSTKLLKLVKKHHPTAIYHGLAYGADGKAFHNFSYRNRHEPCPISKRCHGSNRFSCFETERGWRMKCFSTHCTGSMIIGYLDDTDELIDSAIQIKSKYLLKDPKMKKIIRDWTESKYVLAIKSAMGTGKTHTLKYILSKYKYSKVLWITHRQTLTKNITGSFKDYGFVSYLDSKAGLFYEDRVIVQVDSLKYVTEFCMADGSMCFNQYDLVIIDEIEGCLAHYDSPYLDGPGKSARGTFDLMMRLVKNSSKVVLLDADLGARAKLLIEDLTNPKTCISQSSKLRAKAGATVVYNSYMPMVKTLQITNDTNEFDRQLFNDLSSGLKVCIISMSAAALDPYEQHIKNGGYAYVKHTSKTDDKLKDKLENVNEFWPGFQIVMYSPTIESGVDFNVEHFDRIYAIVTDGPHTCSQRSFLQMLGRIRKIKNYEIPCLYYSIPLVDNKPILDAGIHTYDSMLDHVLEFETLNGKMIIQDVKFSEVEHRGFIRMVRDPESIELKLFDKICILNEVEKYNKDSSIFTTVLTRLISKAGHKYCFTLRDPDAIKEKMLIEREPARDVLISKLEAIDETKCDIPDLLKRQAKSNLVEDEKYALQKHFIMMNLGLKPGDKRTSKYLERFVGKDVLIRRFELLFGYVKLGNPNTDTIAVGKERARLTIVLDLVNRLLRRPKDTSPHLNVKHFESITLTDSQYKSSIANISTDSLYFQKEAEYRPLFSRRKGKDNDKNDHMRVANVLRATLDSYNIFLRRADRKQVEGKRSFDYTLSVDKPMARMIRAKYKEK